MECIGNPLGGVKVSGTHLDGTRGRYSLPIKYAFLEGLKNGHKTMVSDLNHSLGRVESSDLVQNGRNCTPDVVGGLYWAQKRTTLGRPQKTLIWGSFEPPEGFFGRISVSRTS